ncbi:DUF3429 domain-containing protein [Thiosulfativibrio zosterae]|uniref:DUF3429 domain-containing protein n=1 Tax=Thiosulfativibrio zosterae TaxID=2675053 RepID=A0A6F8PM29_9GAMM|nr:DUF3429 domain-containing protein [Thiosulfativibrio zosterae]BBP43163.1 hypothetical protein THMIRHAT_09090 [Thiosulfativibrio zosterae]
MLKEHHWLGYGGLIPFVGLSLLIWLTPWQLDEQLLGHLLLNYSAMILSFLGGVIWMASLVYRLPKHALYVSVFAMLWPWLVLIEAEIMGLSLPLALSIAAFSFIALWLYEKRFTTAAYDYAFFKLRTQLSWVAALSLLLGSLGL